MHKLLIALGAVLGFLALGTGPALAAGVPDIGMSKEAPERVPYGASSEVSIAATNGSGQPYGYNLSFRDVLPAGVFYVPGSGSVGDPQIIPGQPGPGETTLIWSNVADLSPGSSFSVDYQVGHNPGVLAVGDTYTNQASAYINCDPSYVPDFGPDGVPQQSGGNPDCSGSPAEESYTGWAAANAQTELVAIEVEKSEPSPESELMRGLHDHQTVYTIEITDNSIDPTTAITVEDYIPAGLEFLACGTADNTTEAPTNPGSADEYPGSGPINPGNRPSGNWTDDCAAPATVDTVEDPPGLPAGIYTHVTWDHVPDLNPGDTFTITYAAAIPLRENTLDWTGTAPGTGGAQGSNLDNNSGPETFEDGSSERSNTNTVVASGSYDDGSPSGLQVSSEDSETVIAEDLRVLKSVDSGTLASGGISEWTLRISTGEYRFAEDIVVTDTLGNGYCPLGSVNLEVTPPAAAAECDPVVGEEPSHDYSGATENADGTWTLTWDETEVPELGQMGPSENVTISFPTRTRQHYQQNYQDSTPVLAQDLGRNDVSIVGTDFIICAPGAPIPCPIGDPTKIDADEDDGTPDEDVSFAEQEGGAPTLDKQVNDTPNVTDCQAEGSFEDGPGPGIRPGDIVCYRLTMSFPPNLESGGVTVVDFLPAGSVYVPGSTAVTPSNDVTIATSSPPEPDVDGRRLSWPLDDGSSSVLENQTFEVTFKAEVERLPTAADGDIIDNLMKASFTNTPGDTFPLRDTAPTQFVAPVLELVKGVRDINDIPGGGNPPNTDGGTVTGGNVVTYRVEVTNSGSVDVDSAEVWDILPAQITCAMVSAISTPGASSATCNAAEDRIEWDGLAIDAGDGLTVTYDVATPDGLDGGEQLDNTAGVRQYESASGTGVYTSIPVNNIDPSQEPSANAPKADDPSWVEIEQPALIKEQATAVTQSGNNTGNQATIGEPVTYTVTTTIPEGTALNGEVSLVDAFNANTTFVAGSESATIDLDGPGGSPPAPLPSGGFSISGTDPMTIDFPEPYANAIASGADILELTFTVTVDDVAANTAGSDLLNQATLTWDDAAGAPTTITDSTTTRVVEPNVNVTKLNNTPGPVAPDDEVEFTITGSNGTGANVATANDTVIVDTLPIGLTPTNGGTPVSDGGTVNPDGGVWDETARTITWPAIATIAPGDDVIRTYTATVNTNAVGSSTLTNVAELETTSLPDGVPDAGSERIPTSLGGDRYEADNESNLTVVGSGIEKTSDPSVRTIGERTEHTLTVTIPPNIQEFDATVIDDIPGGLNFEDYVSASCTAGCSGGATEINPVPLASVSAGGATEIGWWLGDITQATEARTVVLVYTTIVGAASDGDDLINSAVAAHNLTDEITTPPTTPPAPEDFDQTDGDESTIEVVEPDVILDKEVDDTNPDPGDAVAYTIWLTNYGTSPAYDVVVDDQPGALLTDVELDEGATFSVDGWTAADPHMRWVVPGPIQPGLANAVSLTYTADLVSSAQLSNGDQIQNTADLPTYWGVPAETREEPENEGVGFIDYEEEPVSATSTVHTPDVAVDKTTGLAGFPETGPGLIEQSFPWRVVITNPNAGSELLGVDALDTLPANWSYDSGSAQISGNGDLTPGGQIDPAVTPGAAGDQLAWSNIADLEGSETVVIEFTATPEPSVVFDPGLSHPHINDVEVEGDDTSGASGDSDGDYADEDDATAAISEPKVDLEISKSADDPFAVAGENTTWTLTVTNRGPESAPDVRVEDALPAGLTFVSANPEQGTCAEAAGVVRCELGLMHSGDVVEITLTTLVDSATANEPIINPASVDDPTAEETNPGSNDSDDKIVPAGSADLSITKEPMAPLQTGQLATYRLTVTNEGPSVAEHVVVTDVLPASLTYVGSRGAGCNDSSGTVSCALGDLPVGAVVVIEFGVRVETSGQIINGAEVGGDTPDPDPSDNAAKTSDPAGNTDVAINKTGPTVLVAGTIRSYTLVVSNADGLPTAGPVTVRDEIPTSLRPVRASGNGWSCTIAGQLVTCNRSDPLAAGTAYPLITIRVEALGAKGLVETVNTATVHLDGDPVAANNTDTTRTPQGSRGEARDWKTRQRCEEGSITLNPSAVWVGAAADLTAVVEDAGGNAAARVRVKFRDRSTGKTRTRRTNGRGRAGFKVKAAGTRGRWVATVKACSLKAKTKAKRQRNCNGFKVRPGNLVAGERTRVRMRLRAPDGSRLRGVTVKARGAGTSAKGVTNRKGRARLKLKPKRPGVIKVKARDAFRCTVPIGAVAPRDSGSHLTG